MRTYRYDRLLHWSECDPGGIVFFPHYARWMVDGVNQMFLSLGIDPNRLIDDHTRGALPVLQLSMQFHQPPKLHETLTHEIHVEKLGGKSMAFRHRVFRGDVCLMEANETRVWGMHSLSDPTTLRTLPIPDDVRSLLSQEA